MHRVVNLGWLGVMLLALLLQDFAWAQNNTFTLRASFNGIDGATSGANAADPTIAAGPTKLVIATNDSIRILAKTGGVVDSRRPRDFWDQKPSGDFLNIAWGTDPRAVFDPHSNRFFITANGAVFDNPACTPGTCIARLFLAVSKTSDPVTLTSADWYFYIFDGTIEGGNPTTCWVDFPRLGLGNDVVVVVVRLVPFTPPASCDHEIIRIFDKSKLIRGEPVTWTEFIGMTDPVSGREASNFLPAIHFGNPDSFFLLSLAGRAPCRLLVWGIEQRLSAPTLSARSVTTNGGPCETPPPAIQPGGGTPLETSNARFQHTVVYRRDSLWTSQAISRDFGSGPVSAIRWYQIDVSMWPASVSIVQDSTFEADGIWHFYPALMVDAFNNVALVFARSSASEFASVYYTGRLVTDPPNTLQSIVLLKAGSANLTKITHPGRNRYGDYFSMALDPSDGGFWMYGEYAKASNQWGTWVGNVAASGDLVTASVNQAQFSAGGTLIASIATNNPGLPTMVDLYAGVLLPDGDTIVFVTGGGLVFGRLSNLATAPPWAASVSLTMPSTSSVPNLVTHTWTGSEPRGNYVFFFAAVRAGALADGRIDPGDVVGLSTAPFRFGP